MAILQDRQGFLWLGTEGGLDRYDGYEVRRYIYDRNRPDGLPSSWASTLAEDASGTLWIGTDGGGLVGRESRHRQVLHPARRQ
jgi:ligand-binding sensor domain-containing protein